MLKAPPASPAGSGFDDFLFASIGQGSNGMPVTVLSALARMSVDPWQEAARLARLPAGNAIARLESLVAALPDGSLAPVDPEMIPGLIMRLPDRSGPDTPRFTETGMPVPGQAGISLTTVFYIVAAAFILAAVYLSSNGPSRTDELSLSGSTATAMVAATLPRHGAEMTGGFRS